MTFRVDCLLTTAGLPLFLVDIVLDVLAAVEFYKEGSYLCLGVLLVLLIGSSVLVQLYSWLWYSYDQFEMRTRVEESAKPGLGVLHWVQLGIYVRHVAVMETSVKSCCSDCDSQEEDTAAFLNQDLSMLRIIETFSESAPQIVLMLTVLLQDGSLEPFQVLKTIGSLSAVAYCVTTYHRCLRSFLPEKEEQSILSSLVFFTWNLLLLAARIVALALFASVFPCFIFTHFVCSWLLFCYFAWWADTHFMDTVGGEWLYRATVGLIWYFDWFNVVDGKTRTWAILYHCWILLDVSVLCGLWFWKMSWDPPDFELSRRQAAVVWGAVVAGYALGLVLRIVYYTCFHPKLNKDELRGGSAKMLADEVDSPPDDDDDGGRVMFRSVLRTSTGPSRPPLCNKRMKKLAENFYSSSADGAEV
ncbi:PREDICTED: XK-related protein 8-like [Poecilia mexicana]|uniref:XK-related protein 8-like n=1 Tax=Poecilia mexicana TaxID=48701 RepID=UPI00072DF533|nr:PREDICTED: XK-related protein 8-like [Poecilia mexicana]